MNDQEFTVSNKNSDDFRQVEDVIDSRRLLGQYDRHQQIQQPPMECMSFSSLPETNHRTTVTNLLDNLYENDAGTPTRRTDSEITIMKVRYSDSNNANKKWDESDGVELGDGFHLEENPSLINLVTLVGDTRPSEGMDEYLVPLTSWEPYMSLKCCSEPMLRRVQGLRYANEKRPSKWENSMGRNGRISEFVCNRCFKKRTFSE